MEGVGEVTPWARDSGTSFTTTYMLRTGGEDMIVDSRTIWRGIKRNCFRVSQEKREQFFRESSLQN